MVPNDFLLNHSRNYIHNPLESAKHTTETWKSFLPEVLPSTIIKPILVGLRSPVGEIKRVGSFHGRLVASREGKLLL